MKIDFEYVVINLAADLGLDENTTLYVLSRLKNEGVSFLTCVLPELSKAVMAGLETGHITMPSNFANSPWCFSRFFRVWLLKIFHKDGTVRSNPNPEAIKKIRQFCEYFYKLALPFDNDDERRAAETYKQTEAEVANFEPSETWVQDLKSALRTLYPDLNRYTLDDILSRCKPRYTSGAFFGSEHLGVPFNAYKKLSALHVGHTSKQFKGISGFFRSIKTRFDRVYLSEHQDPFCKVLFVPKDSRGPRVISKEPLNFVRLQMSYFDFMVAYLEKHSSKRVNFLDQSINQSLALQASLDRKNATLDLKEASDRVSFSLVKRLFSDSPALRWFIHNARSTHAFIGEEKITLRKLAGMGSGLTFPTMALLIHLSVCTSVSKRERLPIQEVARSCYVYGDDLIVPTQWYHHAVSGLEASGLRVNTGKSFYRSHFRESCGEDFFKGVRVTPVRLKLSNSGIDKSSVRKTWVFSQNVQNGGVHKYKTWSLHLKTDGALLQMDRHCRELVKGGLLSLASYYYDLLELQLGKAYGYTSGDSAALGRYSPDPIYINDDFVIERYFPSVETFESAGACPYKYLADALNRVGTDAEPGLPFGVFAAPRKVTLSKRQAKAIALR